VYDAAYKHLSLFRREGTMRGDRLLIIFRVKSSKSQSQAASNGWRMKSGGCDVSEASANEEARHRAKLFTYPTLAAVARDSTPEKL
jgi:hypothetical protein